MIELSLLLTVLFCILSLFFVILKRLFPLLKKFFFVCLSISTVLFVYLFFRFSSIFAPIALTRFKLFLTVQLVRFDMFCDSMAKHALPQLSQSQGITLAVSLLSVVGIPLVYVLYRTLLHRRTHQIGAVTRESAQQATSATTITSAPATTDSIHQLLIAALLRHSPENPSSNSPTPGQLDKFEQKFNQTLHDFRKEVVYAVSQELATFSSALALSLPSPTTIVSMVEAATAKVQPDSMSELPPTSPTLEYVLPANVMVVTTDSPFDFECDSDVDDSDDDEPTVNAAHFKSTKNGRTQRLRFNPKKAIEKVPQTTLDTPASQLTEEEVKKILAVKEAERKEAERLLQRLTEEEKQMDLAALHRKWKLEAQQRQQEKLILSEFDFQPLGTLTKEESELTKREVRKIIRQRKHRQWVEAMKAKGVPLHFCDVCQELGTDSHRCLATRFTKETPTGEKNIVLKQTSGGALKMIERRLLDTDKLNEEHKNITAEKKALQEREEWVNKMLKMPDTPVDTSMDGQQTSSSSAVVTGLGSPHPERV